MKKIIFLPVLLLLLINASKSVENNPSTSYVRYNRLITKARIFILQADYKAAMLQMDTIGNTYPFIFARDCIRGLQLALANEDSLRARIWLKSCLLRGVPLHILRSNGITKKAFHLKNCQKTLANASLYYKIYTLSIDTNLAEEMETLFAIDQDFTHNVNHGIAPLRYTLYNHRWKKNNKEQFRRLLQILEHSGFPGEKMIGLPLFYADSGQAQSSIKKYGPALGDHRAYIMFIHYYSTKREDVNAVLYPQVITGCLPGFQYASINDFLAEHGKKKYRTYYYNEWHSSQDSALLPVIDARRVALGLESVADRERMNAAYRELVKRNMANEVVMFW